MRCFVRLTLRISLHTSWLSDGHPSSPVYKRKLVLGNLNNSEDLIYKSLGVRYRRCVLIQDKNDATKHHWNMDRLRKLAETSDLAFTFETSL